MPGLFVGTSVDFFVPDDGVFSRFQAIRARRVLMLLQLPWYCIVLNPVTRKPTCLETPRMY